MAEPNDPLADTTILILVRHGEPTHPAEEGEEPQLTDRGREQATITAHRLAALPQPPRRIHASPMLRAAQTAEIIAGTLGLPITTEDLLAECLPPTPPPALLTPNQREAFDSFTPAEIADGLARTTAVAERYLLARGGVDLLVSHGNLIRWVVTTAIGAPSYAWFQLADYHCGISVLSLRPGRPGALVAYNDVGHLPAELRGVEYPPELRW